MGKHRNYKSQQGSALIWVIILFVVIVILTSSALFIASQNNRETVGQENRLHAYYLSLSGVEIGYALLMTETDSSTGAKYIDGFNETKTDISHHETILDNAKEIGTIDVTIGNVTIDGKRWIQIKSIGKLKDKDVSSSNSLRIDAANHNIIIREQFGQ